MYGRLVHYPPAIYFLKIPILNFWISSSLKQISTKLHSFCWIGMANLFMFISMNIFRYFKTWHIVSKKGYWLKFNGKNILKDIKLQNFFPIIWRCIFLRIGFISSHKQNCWWSRSTFRRTHSNLGFPAVARGDPEQVFRRSCTVSAPFWITSCAHVQWLSGEARPFFTTSFFCIWQT